MRADRYPSRQSSQPEISGRDTAVIWRDPGGVTDVGVAAEQLDAFEREGFLYLPALFDADEVAALLAEAESLRMSAEVRARAECILEPESNVVRSVFAVHKLASTFGELARDPRLLGLARVIVGDDVYLHQTRLNYKPGFDGQEFQWHSDFETWHVEDGMPQMRAVSVSLSLTENHPWNGPLMVIPGSHKSYIACVGETPDDHYKASLRRQEVGIPDRDSITLMVERGGIAAPTGPAGSALFFDCNVLHGSAGNITPLPRTNLFFVYNAVSNALVDPFGPAKPRPDFIAERNPQPL